MTKEELILEISKLRKLVNNLENENNRLKKEISEAENAIDSVRKMMEKLQGFIESVFSDSKRKAIRLPEGNRFGDSYMDALDSIFKGNESSSAVSSADDMKRSANKSIIDNEERIKRNCSLIAQYKARILMYQRQLSQM